MARGMLDGVTRHVGLILGKGPPFVYPPSWVPTATPLVRMPKSPHIVKGATAGPAHVQCNNCNKWRKLSPFTNVTSLPDSGTARLGYKLPGNYPV